MRLLFTLAWLVGGGAALVAEVHRLASDRLQVGVDTGSGRLVELIDRASGYNLVGGPGPGRGLWAIELATPESPLRLEPEAAARCEAVPVAGEAGGRRWRWSGFGGAAAGVAVEVTVRLAADPELSRWELAVTKPRELGLAQVYFPRWTGGVAQPEERLAVPAWMGELHADPRVALLGAGGRGRRLTWEYPGRLSLQCLAFYRDGGPGLYLACDDTEAWRKSFVALGDGRGGVAFEVGHLPEDGARGQERFAPRYGVLLGTLRGDWVTAAERYRGWAERQPWARESRAGQGRVAPWVEGTALWIWNRGRSEGVLGPAAVMQRELGLPVSVLWHWWHGCAYDAGFPEYLPPREGTEPFVAAVAAAQAQGIHALVYMNQRLWGLTTRSWTEEGAERFAVKGPDGAYRKEVYNTFTRQPCVSMCLGTEFWRDKYAGLAERALRELGVAGVYMDQACTSLACFDPAHGHPLGGGRFWLGGFRRLAGDIRDRAPGRKPVGLAGEGTGEAWLPHLDLMLSLQVSRERYAAPADGVEPIPFFQAVYHRHAIQFGNYSSLTYPPYDDLWPAEFAPAEPLQLLDRRYVRQFRLEQARAFVWGQQPMLANFLPAQLQERADEVSYVIRLARLRHATLPHLRHGEFLRPPRLAMPAIESELSRLSIYAGQKGAVTTFRRALPQVVAGAWRAADGSVAVALASLAEESLEVPLDFGPADAGVVGAREVVRVEENGSRRPVAGPDASGFLRVTLPPRGACVLEFVR